MKCKYSPQNIVLEIHDREDKISSQSKRLIDEAYEIPRYALGIALKGK
jgi:hypothetical protein